MPELASSHNPSKLPPDLRKLFPFQSRFQNIAGYQMHYIDEQPANKPDAPVVILVHGNLIFQAYCTAVLRLHLTFSSLPFLIRTGSSHV